MSISFNGTHLGSDHHFEDDSHLEDDHVDDGSKEHTQLLQQDSRDSLKASNRRNGNRSMAHSLYASPKHPVSQRRQASVPGSPIHDEPHSSSSRAAAPLFMNNVAGLWDNDAIKDHHQDETDGSSSSIRGIHRRSSAANSRPTSSLILDDDATPPLPWKEPAGQDAVTDRLSASQRFSMDAIADVGAFAVPSRKPSLSDSQSLPPPSFTEPASVESSLTLTPISTPAAEPKKRRWGPKSQKAVAVEPVVPEEVAIKELVSTTDAPLDTGASTPTKDIAEPLFSPHSYESPSTTAAVATSTPNSEQSSPKQNKISQTGASSAFGLSALSGSGRGLVSGLTSLKNSIMIPALSSTSSSATPTNGNSRDDRTPGSLTGSQSSLLEFLEDSSQPSFMQHQENYNHHRHHTTHRHNQQQTSSRSSSTASSAAGSPSLFRSMFLRSGNDSEYFAGRDAAGSSSMFLERKKPSTTATPHDRSRKESHHHRHHTPRHSTFELSPETKSTSHLQQQQPAQMQSRRKRIANQNTSAATQSLSTHELELQQQMQRQSQLSTRKIELCKELLSLYSRRNSSEQRQAEAVRAERFEEADAATTAIDQVQERIAQLERIYADTDRSLWECKKRQDELGRKICEFHPTVLKEMDDLRLKREAEREHFVAELNQRRVSEVAVLQGERDEIEKDRSDIALEQDFLGKNQSELKERIDEETGIDQDELNDLKEKRKANRHEIEELTRQLEQLNQRDKEWAFEIATVQQRIRTTEEQFSEKSKEVMQDKQKLDLRISDLQKRSQRLDRQEAQLQMVVEKAEGVLDKVQSDVQAIVAQQEHLETVRKMFGDELAIIQKLRVEEEWFREKEAGWSMRSSRWTQEQVRLEVRIKRLTDKVAGDQRVVVELEEGIKGLEKRAGQSESLKVLAVQRRDFKQASHYSGELAKLRETMAQQREELERRTSEITSGSTQKDLAGLQKEYDALKANQKQEQLDLFKEIQEVTTKTLAQLLSACSKKPMSNGSSTTTAMAADKSAVDAKEEEGGSKNTAAGKLLEELQSEIESVLEVSRIRYGRETTVPHGAVDDSTTAAVSAAAAGATIPTAGGDSFVIGKEEQRAALDRDIQAAVAEEDYATAAELQERLEAL
ncbi:hypothetical protein EC957_001271 [Mortierella hygrophila]|uniref:UVR domain-containing protein n=1 Tax=Mortierella hygrophila TaxID=979708 RepID=A0A9P6F607_9FUNG|nr:hypothetical protein EC957_001271 [Mortierella hygrophila]